MFTEDKVTEIFFRADEFCKFFGSLAKPCVNRNKLHYKLPRLVCEESIAREVYGYQLRGQPPPLRVCKNQRIHMHKVFRGIAAKEMCSMGWFFGFKLHVVCNEKME